MVGDTGVRCEACGYRVCFLTQISSPKCKGMSTSMAKRGFPEFEGALRAAVLAARQAAGRPPIPWTHQ